MVSNVPFKFTTCTRYYVRGGIYKNMHTYTHTAHRPCLRVSTGACDHTTARRRPDPGPERRQVAVVAFAVAGVGTLVAGDGSVAPAPAPTPQSVARRPPRRGRVLTFSHMDRSDDRPLPHNQPQTCHVTLTGRLDGTLSTGRFQFHVAAQA